MEQVCKVSIYHSTSTKTQHSHMLWWCTWCPSVTKPLVNVKSSWWMNEDERFVRNSTYTNLIIRLLLNNLCPARAQCTNMSSILVMYSQLPSLITYLFAQLLSLLFFDSHRNSMRILLVCKLCTASSKDLRLLQSVLKCKIPVVYQYSSPLGRNSTTCIIRLTNRLVSRPDRRVRPEQGSR